jgi:hypothetical protein
MMGKVRIGTILRYARPYDATLEEVDGLPNYFRVTHSAGQKHALIEAGINVIQRTPSRQRLPAILIASSPHKAGSEATPWQDFFHADTGHIRYFGDNKSPGVEPSNAKGNAALLAQFDLQRSRLRRDRLKAAPLIFFRRTRVANRSKGNVVFQGFGVIDRVERIVQHDAGRGWSFTNYAFDFAVMSIASEAEEFDWNWITARRDDKLTEEDVLSFAPASWRTWINEGTSALAKCRRRVSKILVVPTAEQRPKPASWEHKVLDEIYRFYDGRKHRFEGLAEYVAARILKSAGTYRTGWITPLSSDGGADFIGRLDVGSELARVKLVVLGQAKCEKPNVPTGGNHIARTVARLRRGWIGVYVTTSYFSDSVQREVIEDKYPIVLVDGLRLAREVDAARFEQGLPDVLHLLREVDELLDNIIVQRDPEEILLE